MAISSSVIWRVRKTGSNANGGGYDPSISSAATGSHGTWSTSGGVTTFTDATAAAFTSSMVGSGLLIGGFGLLKILSFVDSSHVTIQTPNNTNEQNSGSGALYNWVVGGGTDYSQQDAAQASWTNLTCTGNASTTLTDGGATGLFTSVMIGNAIQISGGTGFTAGFYFVISVTDANNVVLDRTPASSASAASGASGKLGGAFADFWTSINYTNGNFVAGNILYILGYQASPSTSPYTYDYTTPTSYIQYTSGATTTPLRHIIGDPTGPRPVIRSGSNDNRTFGFTASFLFKDLWLIMHATFSTYSVVWSAANSTFINVTCDQVGFDEGLCSDNACTYINCEVFSSVSSSGGSNYALNLGNDSSRMIGCNIHDTKGHGVYLSKGGSILNSIISNCGGWGIVNTQYSGIAGSIVNSTIDGNKSGGISMASADLAATLIINNIISNHSGISAVGINVSSGTLTDNNNGKSVIDYNVFYNNTTHISSVLSMGVHSTIITSSPYVGNSTDENYTLV